MQVIIIKVKAVTSLLIPLIRIPLFKLHLQTVKKEPYFSLQKPKQPQKIVQMYHKIGCKRLGDQESNLRVGWSAIKMGGSVLKITTLFFVLFTSQRCSSMTFRELLQFEEDATHEMDFEPCAIDDQIDTLMKLVMSEKQLQDQQPGKESNLSSTSGFNS